MGNPTNTRQVLLDEGRRMMLTHGFDGVGIGAILSAAGVPKGSFYHYFDSKESFAEAVLDDYERYYIAFRKRYLDDASRPPLERVEAYFEALEVLHLSETPVGGCLFGVMAQTASLRGSTFRARLASIFTTWTNQIASSLDAARAAGEIPAETDTRAAAAFLIDAYQGAVLRMKVEGGSAPFERFKTQALATLRRP